MRSVGTVVGWWIRDYAYALAQQVRALVGRSDPDAYRSGSRTPIVVLPGIYETWRFVAPLITQLHDRGHPVHVIEPLRWNRRPVADTAEEVGVYLRAHALVDVVVVAHSKGGLVGKQVMLGPEGHRIRGMVAVAAPFGGSRYAGLLPIGTLRGLSPRDATIRALSRNRSANARIVSIAAEFDPHIPEGSDLIDATNITLDTGGHFRILAHPRVRAEILRMCDAAGA